MQVYQAFHFSIWPSVAVNILYFLVHVIDGFGGGYRRNSVLVIAITLLRTDVLQNVCIEPKVYSTRKILCLTC